jgi:thioredoxin 1
MKQILYFYLKGCPFCRQANRWMEEVVAENPAYREIPVRRVEERQERDYAAGFDYYLVPTYYVDGVKVHEGAASKEIVESVYKRAFESVDS